MQAVQPRTLNEILSPVISPPPRHETRIRPQPARRPSFDMVRLEAAVREMLLAIGENPDREGLIDTPARVAKAYAQIFAGLQQDPATHLERVFHEGSNDLVVVRRIAFHSVCEHHMLPIEGQAHIAYLPQAGRVVGLSKLARTVEVFARRPQLQERLTTQVADALVEHLDPAGVLVVIEADHFCMKMRGVENPCSNTVTLAARGVFKSDAAARAEALSLIHNDARR